MLHEDAATPLAMFMVPSEADAAYRLALDALIASSDLSTWTWSPGDEPMPALPV